ncbi:hypothetical protein GGF46_001095 [Coemansia sp. RSA 552]|nr:hypothetical protein GGF46_001095 [Coemansia sp. RSA 552]
MAANNGGLQVPFIASLARRFRVVLASGSPRRKELFDRLGIAYDVIPSAFPEDLDQSQFASAGDYVLENAVQKANEVYWRIKSESEKPLFVVGSDTVVVGPGGAILEKPASSDDAVAALASLSGATSAVYTGVCLLVDVPDKTTPHLAKAVESTRVTFDELDEALLRAYVATGEPMDKAGSYAYQSLACFFVRDIQGDYYNVVGFPCNRFYRMLRELHQQNII